MGIGWLTVLRSVPWADVISNAPKVAEGARKLWTSASKRPAEAEAPADPAVPGAAHAPPTVAALQAQVAALEAAVGDLHQQLVASSELIKALAEQNAQLVARVDLLRRRARWLAAATAVALLLGLACVGLLAGMRAG